MEYIVVQIKINGALLKPYTATPLGSQTSREWLMVERIEEGFRLNVDGSMRRHEK